MTQPYKVFVGTLSCGEGDYEECIKSINRQKNVLIEHIVIKDLPERQAHDELFSTWSAIKNSFDFFVKIDADTVLSHPFVLEFMGNMFKSNERFTSIQAPLNDYFTNGFINGLNAYIPRVVFNSSPELYCDRVDTNHDIQVGAKSVVGELIPAGFHCYNSTNRQAFHFGLHRMLKGQSDIINKVRKAHEADVINGFQGTREYALAGAAVAHISKDQHNYADELFEQLFQAADKQISSTRK